jgi:hypothetical protein
LYPAGGLQPPPSWTREQIAEFHEYRTALISAAVTGKIDVRGYTSEAELLT